VLIEVILALFQGISKIANSQGILRVEQKNPADNFSRRREIT
jgi:hypothetical protein